MQTEKSVLQEKKVNSKSLKDQNKKTINIIGPEKAGRNGKKYVDQSKKKK